MGEKTVQKNPVDMTVKIGGLTLQNPVMTASGTFGYGGEYAPLMEISRLGAMVTKTITLEPRLGNPQPRIWELPYGMLNSIGLANIGVENFIGRALPQSVKFGIPVIVNIAGKDEGDYGELIRILDGEEGVAAYELNVSCPNVKKGGLLFGADSEAVGRITADCRKATDKPIIVKLTPNVADIAPIAKSAEAAGADGLTVANTVLGMAVDIETRKPRIPFVTAGYSGPGIKPVNLAKVYQARQAVKIPIIGCGGIMNWPDAVEYIITGAAAVQVGSATYKNPRIAIEVIEGIERYLIGKGVDSIGVLTASLYIVH